MNVLSQVPSYSPLLLLEESLLLIYIPPSLLILVLRSITWLLCPTLSLYAPALCHLPLTKSYIILDCGASPGIVSSPR